MRTECRQVARAGVENPCGGIAELDQRDDLLPHPADECRALINMAPAS